MSRRGENIFKRKDGLWEARYVKGLDEKGKKKYGSVYAHSYREVKEKREELASQIVLMPQFLTIRKATLNALIQEWLFVNQARLKPSTYQKYCGFHTNHIQERIGQHQLIYLTPVVLKRYADSKSEEGLSPKTVNSILTFIHGCLRYANRQYGLPLTEIIYLKESKREMRVLSRIEQQKLVHYLLTDTDIYKLGVLVALYTGIRIGELCALKWSDIENGTLHITKTMQRLSKGIGKGTEIIVGDPKTSTSNRTIPLPSFISAQIEKFRSNDKEAYFLSTPSHPLTEPRVMQYYFQRYIEELGLPKANFHCLRHTFATRCVECDFEIKTLSLILGHSNVKTTMDKYVHSSMSLKAVNMEKLQLFL